MAGHLRVRRGLVLSGRHLHRTEDDFVLRHGFPDVIPVPEPVNIALEPMLDASADRARPDARVVILDIEGQRHYVLQADGFAKVFHRARQRGGLAAVRQGCAPGIRLAAQRQIEDALGRAGGFAFGGEPLCQRGRGGIVRDHDRESRRLAQRGIALVHHAKLETHGLALEQQLVHGHFAPREDRLSAAGRKPDFSPVPAVEPGRGVTALVPNPQVEPETLAGRNPQMPRINQLVESKRRRHGGGFPASHGGFLELPDRNGQPRIQRAKGLG